VNRFAQSQIDLTCERRFQFYMELILIALHVRALQMAMKECLNLKRKNF